jgi:WD40 repeat protein
VFWNLTDGKRVVGAAREYAEPIVIGFNGDGRLLLETGLSGHVRLLDTNTGAVNANYSSIDPLQHGALSRDGRLAAITGAAGTVLFEITPTSLAMRDRLQPAADQQSAWAGTKVAFNADGSRLMTMSPSGIVVWDTATLAVTASVLDQQDVPYLDAALGPQGTIALATTNGRAALRTATDLRPLRFHTRDVRRVVFARDGHSVATMSKDGFVAVWDIETPTAPTAMQFDELLDWARERVPVGLSEDYRNAVLAR